MRFHPCLLLWLPIPFLVGCGEGRTAGPAPVEGQATSSAYTREEHPYALPEVRLLDRHGQPFAFPAGLPADRPVLLQFVFTTCGTICPILSNTFREAREELEGLDPRPLLVSLSIDPEQDTPEALRDYAAGLQAGGSDWVFLTGRREDIEAVQKAFDAWHLNKMNHEPLTFLRAPGSSSWVRLNGLTSAAQLVREARGLLRP